LKGSRLKTAKLGMRQNGILQLMQWLAVSTCLGPTSVPVHDPANRPITLSLRALALSINFLSKIPFYDLAVVSDKPSRLSSTAAQARSTISPFVRKRRWIYT
jgi:hypothetical protein